MKNWDRRPDISRCRRLGRRKSSDADGGIRARSRSPARTADWQASSDPAFGEGAGGRGPGPRSHDSLLPLNCRALTLVLRRVSLPAVTSDALLAAAVFSQLAGAAQVPGLRAAEPCPRLLPRSLPRSPWSALRRWRSPTVGTSDPSTALATLPSWWLSGVLRAEPRRRALRRRGRHVPGYSSSRTSRTRAARGDRGLRSRATTPWRRANLRVRLHNPVGPASTVHKNAAEGPDAKYARRAQGPGGLFGVQQRLPVLAANLPGGRPPASTGPTSRPRRWLPLPDPGGGSSA
jgi:hypothetical protein